MNWRRAWGTNRLTRRRSNVYADTNPVGWFQNGKKVLPYARYLAGRFNIPIELFAVVDIAEMAAQLPADKARFLDTLVEDGVNSQYRSISRASRAPFPTPT